MKKGWKIAAVGLIILLLFLIFFRSVCGSGMTKFCIRGRHVVRIGSEKLDKVLTDMVCFIEHNETVMKKSEEKQNAE